MESRPAARKSINGGHSNCGPQLQALWYETGEERKWGPGGWPPGEFLKDTPPRIPEKPPLQYTIKIGVFFAASLLPCEGDAIALQIAFLSVGGSHPHTLRGTCNLQLHTR